MLSHLCFPFKHIVRGVLGSLREALSLWIKDCCSSLPRLAFSGHWGSCWTCRSRCITWLLSRILPQSPMLHPYVFTPTCSKIQENSSEWCRSQLDSQVWDEPRGPRKGGCCFSFFLCCARICELTRHRETCLRRALQSW